MKEKEKKSVEKGKRGVLYVYVVILFFICVVAVFWFIQASIFVEVQSVATGIAEDLGSNSTTYTLIDTFYTYLYKYVLVLALIGLSIWVYIYTQRETAQGGGYY